MRKILCVMCVAATLIGCSSNNTPGKDDKTPKLDEYLIDTYSSKDDFAYSKATESYNENDELILSEMVNYSEYGVGKSVSKYTYQGPYRYGIHYYNDEISGYDTVQYDSQKLPIRESALTIVYGSKYWNERTNQYKDGKLVKFYEYSNGVLTLEGDLTYNGDYCYTNGVGYPEKPGDYYLKSVLETTTYDSLARVISKETIQENTDDKGNTGNVRTVSTFQYWDNKSTRVKTNEFTYHGEYNTAVGNQTISDNKTTYTYNWKDDKDGAVRYGVKTYTENRGGNNIQSLTYDTAYCHIKKK